MSKINPLYEERLLIFMEDINKGVFNQVIINKAQFKKISDAVCTRVSKDDSLKKGFELAQIEIGEKELLSYMFDGMSSIDEE